MIVFEKGEEFSLPINDTADNWRSYYMAVKFRNTASRFYLRAVYSQSALWMAYDQLLCNELIRNHSRETNTTYAYKIRLRTDYAPVAPFPPLHTVDFGTDKAPKVRISTATALQRRQRGWLCGWQEPGRSRWMSIWIAIHVTTHGTRVTFGPQRHSFGNT